MRGAGAQTCDGAAEGTEQSRKRYASASVVSPAACVAETQTRTCSEGAWSPWSGSYVHEDCEVRECAAGTTETRERFASEHVPFGEQCRAETQQRSCEQGRFTSWSGTFEHEACVVEAPRNCPGLAHGDEQTRVRYAAPEAFNQPCQAETSAGPATTVSSARGAVSSRPSRA